ncbi:MAG TPA: gamma-glutamyltransferase [Gemmatimonadaceae bacterium]|nr:gamma-glutamyltransferase [Gemmatimonadaceae bacterium]
MYFALFLLALQQPAADSALRGVRDPAYAPDGRLVVSIDGDLYLQAAGGGAWSRLTSGPAWDREPAWSRDGTSIVFSSDKAGNFDLWRVPAPAAASGIPAQPERITTSPEPDAEPSTANDGRIIFVRGRGDAARLWARARDGTEQRLTRGQSAERSPVVSPDGAHLAYIAASEAGRRLRVRALTGDSTRVADSVVVTDRDAEHPTWAPNGDRLAFTTGGARPGVFVTPTDGRYTNLISSRHAAPAWAPDGRTIAMAELGADPPGYNGDPARVADRDVSEDLTATGRLWTVTAPSVPDDGLAERRVAATRTRQERNAEAFDRVWTRTDELYFRAPEAASRRQRWTTSRDRFRALALAAPSDSALDDVIHAMLRERPPLREAATGRAAVSSAHPLATAAGLEILRKGGNVVDAAVAVSFALGVVEPDASGPGGYGQMLIQTKGADHPALIEFMSRVPEEATLSNAGLMTDGRYPPDGPVLANVPGTVAGMHSAWRQFGSKKVPWADLLAPAIRAAKDGYVVSEGLATTLTVEREHFAKYESSRALFFRNGAPLHAGDTLKNPDLAWTLEQIAKGGADGFYRGEVARRMVTDLRGKGNAMRLTDLARYFAADREPVSSTFRGYTLYSSAPPVSGGATLAAQLNLLEQWKTPKVYSEDAATAHAMIAAWQLTPTTRNRIADPGLWPVTVEPLVSKDTARVRWRCFDPARALAPTVFRGDTLVCAPERKATTDAGENAESGSTDLALETARGACGDPAEHAREVVACHSSGTTAFTVADADGNVVAVTQTLGTWGGNFYVSPGLGFIYNDKLTSYGTDPTQYGARLPYARHGSTLAPTIVFQGTGAARRPVLAVGAAGNAWITSAVYETLVGVLDFGLTPQQALELPRFLPSARGAGARREFVIDVEGGFSPSALRRLRAMGYNLNVISLPGEPRMGYGAAVSLGRGSVTAGADPRRAGAAGAIP